MTLVNHETGELIETLDESAARRLTDRIKLLAEGIADQVEKMASLIDEARTGLAWSALGYASWPAYVSGEFAGVLPRLDREPRQEFVRELSSLGMSTRAIAPVVGSSHMTVDRDLKAPVTPVTPPTDEFTQAEHEELLASFNSGPGSKTPPLTRPDLTGLDGKTYLRPVRPDHAALADAAIAEFPDLAYYRDEAIDLEHCWRLAETLRSFADDEQASRLNTLRRAIEVDRSKRDGTYVPPTYPTATNKTCPTCGQEVQD